jgi:hypothetical protein
VIASRYRTADVTGSIYFDGVSVRFESISLIFTLSVSGADLEGSSVARRATARQYSRFAHPTEHGSRIPHSLRYVSDFLEIHARCNDKRCVQTKPKDLLS